MSALLKRPSLDCFDGFCLAVGVLSNQPFCRSARRSVGRWAWLALGLALGWALGMAATRFGTWLGAWLGARLGAWSGAWSGAQLGVSNFAAGAGKLIAVAEGASSVLKWRELVLWQCAWCVGRRCCGGRSGSWLGGIRCSGSLCGAVGGTAVGVVGVAVGL
jgi:hypothetical protein